MSENFNKNHRMVRPRILINTARIAGKGFRRKRTLNYLFKGKFPQKKSVLLAILRAKESECESLRLLGECTYSARHHVDLMAALLAELDQL